MRRLLAIALTVLGCAPEASVFVPEASEVLVAPVPVEPLRPNPFSEPCLELTPSSVTLAPVVVGCTTASQTVAVRNRCRFTVRVSSAGPVEGFGVARVPPPLAPGAQGELGVRHVPSAPGSRSARVVVRALADGYAQDAALEVMGTASTARTVSFIARPPPRIPPTTQLFVVDDELPGARDMFAFLARFFRFSWGEGLPGTWRVAVVDLTGVLSRPDGVAILDPTDPEFERRFLEAALPPKRPGRRSCFEAIEAVKASGQLPGFFDADVFRGAVCVTDELDESERSGSAMQAVWERRAGGFQPSFSLVAPYGGCAGAVDARLDALSRATPWGAREDLCGGHWNLAFENWPTGGWGSVTVFLPPTPPLRSPTTLDVRIQGLPLIARPGVWEYRSEPPSVRFGPLGLPDPGVPVELRWETCDP